MIKKRDAFQYPVFCGVLLSPIAMYICAAPLYKSMALQNSHNFHTMSNDPLHGKTLEVILNELVAHFGWEELGRRITINCFMSNPSIKSSLTFLRKTPWARKKVEDLYVRMLERKK